MNNRAEASSPQTQAAGRDRPRLRPRGNAPTAPTPPTGATICAGAPARASSCGRSPTPNASASISRVMASGAAGAGGRSRTVATIERRLSALVWNFAQRSLPFDLAGVRRTHGRPPVQREALLPEHVLAVLDLLPPSNLRNVRDRAILLLGVLLTLRGKTGWREVEIGRGSWERTCPVAALETWLKFARIARGRVFRVVVGSEVRSESLNDRHVARLIKRLAFAAGVRGDLSERERREKFSGHLLRAGLALAAEIDERYVQKHL